MAKALDWNALYKIARQNVKPTYRKLRRMDSDDWLAAMGLERRNIAVDVMGAFGFILLGCAIGVGVGMMMAPKAGSELRQDLTKRVRETADQFGMSKGSTAPTYAS